MRSFVVIFYKTATVYHIHLMVNFPQQSNNFLHPKCAFSLCSKRRISNAKMLKMYISIQIVVKLLWTKPFLSRVGWRRSLGLLKRSAYLIVPWLMRQWSYVTAEETCLQRCCCNSEASASELQKHIWRYFKTVVEYEIWPF